MSSWICFEKFRIDRKKSVSYRLTKSAGSIHFIGLFDVNSNDIYFSFLSCHNIKNIRIVL